MLPESKGTFAYGQVKLTEQAELLKQVGLISVPVQRTNPEPMEKLGQDYGFILYQTRISGPRERQELVVQEVHDRALVFVDGQFQGVLERGNDALSVSFEVPAEGANLSILVENMGRINYGPYLRDPKGITEGVRHGFQFLFDWTIHCLPLTELYGLQFGERSTDIEGPAFYRGTFK